MKTTIVLSVVAIVAVAVFLKMRQPHQKAAQPQMKVALLYTLGEANSASAVAQMKQALHEAGIETSLIGVQQTSEIAMATARAVQLADAIWVPADNLLVSAMPLIAQIAREQKKPLYVSDPPSVERGALACVGVDYEEAGVKSAKIAAQVLREQIDPKQIPIYEEKNPPIHINPDTARLLTLALPSVR